ncbi:glutathione-disulfide reductase [Thalassobaculum fulvum]|uniref:Glutathione reductase n=1 Tax=Thalassobaculum fulvum TaxID=1633335 RepID=A0A919CS96_9PROT|nr:glutathione-disulfide reductase [Thalassobaculum fulvum]GHD61638.1 glutathione-disulfide reductase [Thalassobaculum fulvum]
MARYDYDLITIGAGSGGVRASRLAGRYGAKVAVVEELRVGGTCVLRGCVPKKLLVYGSHLRHEIEDMAGYGWSVEGVSHDWGAMIAAKEKELDRLHGIYMNLLKGAGNTVLDGRGVVVDPHTVAVDGKRYTAERILIATGGWPTLPDVPGIEHAITSNEALDLTERPQRVAIVGSGFIAVEFAGIFHGFGSETHLIYRADKVLRGFDEDVRTALTAELEKKGINLLPETLPTRIEKADGCYVVHLSDGETLEVDAIMYATGRAPNTKGLGLAEAGVELTANGAVKVDEWSRSSVPSIWAIGDVTDRIQLTPVALAEGQAFAETEFNGNPIRPDHDDVPSAVFSQPPVGTVGLTEAQAREKYGDLDVYVSGFRPMKYTLTHNTERGFMKLIVDRGSQRVVGAHMLGVDAPEIIQGVAIAVRMGATKRDFDRTIGIHPTAAEEFVTMREKRPEPQPGQEAAE